MKLPAGVRVLEQRVERGRLIVSLAVERTPTAENAHGCADGASATAKALAK